MGILGYITLVFLVLLGGAGLVLLFQGLRGKRIAPHLVCRACRFDLSGLNNSQTCPECGGALTEKDSMRLITRQRRPGRAWAGVALVALALAGPCVLAVDALASGSLTRNSPTWLLALQTRMLGTHNPAIATGELLARAQSGKVADSTLESVARSIMSIRTGDESLSDDLDLLVGLAGARALVSKDDMARHIITPQLVDVQVPERVRQGEPLVLRINNWFDAERRLPPDGVWTTTRRITALEIDGVKTPSSLARTAEEERVWAQQSSRTPSCVSGGYPFRWGERLSVPPVPVTTPGKHVLRVHYTVEAYLGRTDTAPGAWPTTRDYAVEVIPADKPLVRMVEDAAFKQQMKDRLFLTVAHSSGPGFPNMCQFSLREKALPLDRPAGLSDTTLRLGGAWTATVEIDGDRQPTGTFKFGWKTDGQPFGAITFGGPKFPKDARKCRVILTPDEHLAAERDAIDAMPAGEIIFEDVPIRN